jgi:threonine dehydrogenase-like Zn-dependent dehydrogenase
MNHAIMFTAAGRAELVEVDEARVGAGEVAGPTLASLISPGTELALYTNKPSLLTSTEHHTSPLSPGYAAVFRVEELGDGVNNLERGQLVYCMGGHRSWQRHPADQVLPIPAELSPAIAVFARMAGISMTTLATTAARPPGPVLVLGLGQVGNLAAQVFEISGYEVVAIDPSEARVHLARACGIKNARTALDFRAAGTLAAAAKPAQSGQREFSLVLHCSGHEDDVLQGCRWARRGGEVVLVATPWAQRTDTAAYELLVEIHLRYINLRSGWEWELPLNDEPWRRGSILANHDLALRWLAEAKLRVNGIAAEIDPQDAQEAYQSLLHREPPLSRVFKWKSAT